MRQLCTFLFFTVMTFVSHAQTLDELKKQKADLEAKVAPIQAQADAIKAEIAGINGKISAYPGWYKGAFGTLGANFLGRNQWFAAGDLKDSRATTIMGSFNSFANLIESKYFWRNSGSLNLGWQKLTKGNEPANAKPKFEPVADVFNVTSLFGYNISSKLAASALGEYRTSVIRQFNNPGYLDLGVGVTYTPMKNMVFVFHPLNYNFVFAEDETKFSPSLGCKVVGDYNTAISKGVNWRTNITGFLSYKDTSPSLHNGTWTNWLGFNLFNGIGVGVEFALRYSEQEVAKTQNYYTVGLSYKL